MKKTGIRAGLYKEHKEMFYVTANGQWFEWIGSQWIELYTYRYPKLNRAVEENRIVRSSKVEFVLFTGYPYKQP